MLNRNKYTEILGTFIRLPSYAVFKLLFEYWLHGSLHVCGLTLLFCVWHRTTIEYEELTISKVDSLLAVSKSIAVTNFLIPLSF